MYLFLFVRQSSINTQIDEIIISVILTSHILYCLFYFTLNKRHVIVIILTCYSVHAKDKKKLQRNVNNIGKKNKVTRESHVVCPPKTEKVIIEHVIVK